MLARGVIEFVVDRIATASIVIETLEGGLTQMSDLDEIYSERNQLVAALAVHHPASVGIDPAEPDWPIVYIQLPNGQVSWHFGPNDVHLIDGIPSDPNVVWDGHNTEEKYRRLQEFTREMLRNGPRL